MVCQKKITHEDSINNFVSISEYIENEKYIPSELKGKFKVPNLPLHVHTEGPLLSDHLQAMLNVLNHPEQLPDEYGEYKRILMDPKNKEFFIYFILWHDIAKTIIEPSTIVEEGRELSLYPKHERLSYEMFMAKYADYAADLGDYSRNILAEVIRLHGELYKVSQKPMTKEDYIDFLNNNDVDKDNAAKIMPFLIAADILDVHGTIRPDPWHERPLNFAKGFTENAMAVRVDRLIEVYVNEFSNNIIHPWEDKKMAYAKWDRIDNFYTRKFYEDVNKAKIPFSFLWQLFIQKRDSRARYYNYDGKFLVAFFRHDPSYDNKLKIAEYFFKHNHSYYFYDNLDQVVEFFKGRKELRKKHKDGMNKLIKKFFLKDTVSFTREVILKKNSFAKDILIEILLSDTACVEMAKDYSERKIIRKRDKEFYELLVWLDADRQEKSK